MMDVRKSEQSHSRACRLCREVAAIERQQPLPMPLGGVAVVDRPLWKRKTVMGAGIDFDLGIGVVVSHSLFYFLDDLRRGVDVGFRTAEIELGFCLLPGQMRAVGLVGGQMRAVDRGGGLDALRKMRRRVNRIAS